MLVRIAFGSRVGHVVDYLPHEALAMLTDGRATDPNATVIAPVVTEQVAARVDRGMPTHKRRAIR